MDTDLCPWLRSADSHYGQNIGDIWVEYWWNIGWNMGGICTAIHVFLIKMHSEKSSHATVSLHAFVNNNFQSYIYIYVQIYTFIIYFIFILYCCTHFNSIMIVLYYSRRNSYKSVINYTSVSIDYCNSGQIIRCKINI